MRRFLKHCAARHRALEVRDRRLGELLAVRLDGLDAQAEVVGHLLVRRAPRQLTQHLFFARRQLSGGGPSSSRLLPSFHRQPGQYPVFLASV